MTNTLLIQLNNDEIGPLKTQNGRNLKWIRLMGFIFYVLLSNSTMASELTLTWNDNSDNEDGFYIERSTEGAAFQQIAAVTADVASYTDSTVIEDLSYTYRVKAYNEFGDSGYSNTAIGLIEKTNTPPTISSFSDLSIFQDNSTGAISFTIDDTETSASALTISTSSSNTSLLPNSSIALSGNGSNRSANLTPSIGANGTTTVTFTVSDGNHSVSESFTLNVQSVTPPTISLIDNQSIIRGGSFAPIPFAIGDIETTAKNLSISVTSSNAILIPFENINITGTENNRYLHITPTPSQIGMSNIAVTVSDGADETTQSFDVSVFSPPIILVQPTNTLTMVGEASSLTIGIEAYPTATYQWFRNGVPIEGANNAQLLIAESMFSDEGLYKVQATNSHGNVLSIEIQLDIDQIINNPDGLQVIVSKH